MNPDALDKDGNIKAHELKSVSLYSLGAQDAKTVEEERKIVENKMYQKLMIKNPKNLKMNIINLISLLKLEKKI